MPRPEIEEFAKILVRQIRDTAVRNSDGLLAANAASPAAKRWRDAGAHPAVSSVMIPDVVDEAVFCLLNAIDQKIVRLKFVSDSGREVDLAEDGEGELAGWYMGSGGWRSMFAEERFFDDFADLSQ